MGSADPGTTLVLGGRGFLGAHVVAALGGDVVSASRESGPVKASRFVRLDARTPGDLEKVLAEVRPSRIFDCAAYSSVAEAENQPDLAKLMNVEVPRALASWCAKSGARLVHVSTDLVFGGKPPPPSGFREEDATSPVSEYGRSKVAGETALLEACPAASIVRLPLIYGDSYGRGRGASDSLLVALANGLRPMLLTDEWRTPIEVGNAAAALVELSTLDASGILHIAGPDRISRYDLGMTVIDVYRFARGRPREQVRAGTRSEAKLSGRPADVSLDASRARGLLRTPLLGVHAGLEKAYGRR
jgi:dTDP-4-dehydrorhamnose reductase